MSWYHHTLGSSPLTRRQPCPSRRTNVNVLYIDSQSGSALSRKQFDVMGTEAPLVFNAASSLFDLAGTNVPVIVYLWNVQANVRA